MKLFTRRVLLRGTPSELMAFHTDMAAFVSAKAGREIALWNIVAGAPNGSVAYTTRVEGLDDITAMMGAIIGDAEYTSKVEQIVDRLVVPSEDMVATVLHGEVGDGSPPVGAWGVVSSAVIAPGAYMEAVAWGADVADYAGEVGGLPVLLTMDDFGDFGRVNWVSVGPDAGTVEGALMKMNADEGYMKRLGTIRDMFVPGSGSRVLGFRAA